ncbi:TPA: hypothetical protein JLY13_002172 [Escherichia coli]|nr:hypothetical protein [Escherichia ruysiae]HAL9678861.1 hypothetical protein [Escherichia coli]HAV7814962.1 hypothetical protein [Escherichia coli]HAW5068149.1 hypothetical protein [Escherichia coli]HBC1287146.1 hypothetical protein [Escherichia coli]
MLRNMKIFITAQQPAGIKDFHVILRDKHICAQVKAILPASEGWCKETIESGQGLNPIARISKLITGNSCNNRYFRKIHMFRGAILIFF